MKKFIALLTDKQTDTFNDELLMAHVAHLQKLQDLGVLELCGPFTDDSSAIQIILSKDKESAEQLIMSDPFIEHGYYASVSIKELIQATAENNWLIDDSQTIKNRKKESDL